MRGMATVSWVERVRSSMVAIILTRRVELTGLQ
jgi:hypothetical protein